MMTRGSTKAVVVSSPSSNQARTCRVRADHLGCAGGPSCSLAHRTLDLMFVSLLGGESLRNPRCEEACSSEKALAEEATPTDAQL
jgi:hypothetical protein